MIEDRLAPDEQLSPELVLVLPPELRAQALERLGEPVWLRPRARPRPQPRAPLVAVPVEEPFARSFGRLIGARAAQLVLIFVAVTVVTLAMSVVAQALR